MTTEYARLDGLTHVVDRKPCQWSLLQNAIRRLMSPDDMLETFSELAVKESDLMRIVLQASVAAPVNVQSVEAVDAEMKRRAVTEN